MAAIREETIIIRQIQGLAVLLASLPADGKTRQFFRLALESHQRDALERLGPPEDSDSNESFVSWLEGLWARDDLSAAEQNMVAWQKNPDNMIAAVDEFRGLYETLRRPYP
jgi:hypothetical protein